MLVEGIIAAIVFVIFVAVMTYLTIKMLRKLKEDDKKCFLPKKNKVNLKQKINKRNKISFFIPIYMI